MEDLNNSTGKTRVTAHYIRKMAKKYNVEIKHQLHSQEIKTFYVHLIAEAIIEAEIAEMTHQERNIAYCSELNEALANNPCFQAYKIDYLTFNAHISCVSKFAGVIGINMFSAVWFRTATDRRMVQRQATNITSALNRLASHYLNSLRPASALA